MVSAWPPASSEDDTAAVNSLMRIHPVRGRDLNLTVLPKVLKQLGLQPGRTSQNDRFRLWTLRSAIVILALEWIRYITDGGIASGGPGKSAESFATCASVRRTTRTSRYLY
jgi:hypothetical protein